MVASPAHAPWWLGVAVNVRSRLPQTATITRNVSSVSGYVCSVPGLQENIYIYKVMFVFLQS